MMHEAVFLDKICIISLLQFSVTYVVLVAQELLLSLSCDVPFCYLALVWLVEII